MPLFHAESSRATAGAPSDVTMCAWAVVCCRFHLLRRFWNHILTCVSVSCSRPARRHRSALDRYWLTANVVSSSRTCRRLNTVRDFFFRSPMTSTVVGRLSAAARVALPTCLDAASSSMSWWENSDTKHHHRIWIVGVEIRASQLGHQFITLSVHLCVQHNGRNAARCAAVSLRHLRLVLISRPIPVSDIIISPSGQKHSCSVLSICCRCVSVCLSVRLSQDGTVLKWSNAGSRNNAVW